MGPKSHSNKGTNCNTSISTAIEGSSGSCKLTGLSRSGRKKNGRLSIQRINTASSSLSSEESKQNSNRSGIRLDNFDKIKVRNYEFKLN